MNTTSASSAPLTHTTACPLNLDRDGTLKSFPQELGERVAAYQRTSDSQGLAHELMIIHHDTPPALEWAVEAVTSTLKKDTISWNCVALKSSSAARTELPAILTPLKPWIVLRAAHGCGLVKLSWWHRRAWSLGAISAALLYIGLFGGLAPRFGTLPWSERLVGVVSTPMVLGGALLCALVGGWGALLLSRTLQQRSKELRKALAAGCSQHHPDPAFLDKIGAELLTLSLPLALVIEDYETLDSFTKAALAALLVHEQHTRIGLVLWVVFEEHSARSSLLDSVSTAQSEQRCGGVSKRSYTMRLQPSAVQG